MGVLCNYELLSFTLDASFHLRVIPKFAPTLAEVMIAPATVLRLIPNVISISSGLLPMLRSLSSTLFVAGNTLVSAFS